MRKPLLLWTNSVIMCDRNHGNWERDVVCRWDVQVSAGIWGEEKYPNINGQNLWKFGNVKVSELLEMKFSVLFIFAELMPSPTWHQVRYTDWSTVRGALVCENKPAVMMSPACHQINLTGYSFKCLLYQPKYWGQNSVVYPQATAWLLWHIPSYGVQICDSG